MIRLLATAFALICSVATSAQVAPHTLVPIHLTGDPDTRINYVIMADGFTASEQQAFRDAAETFKDLLLGASPYVRYADYFNVYRLETVSNASGVSTPGNVVDTALRSELGCFNIDRLLCADSGRANALLAEAAPDINFHIRLVAVNTQTYGGGGGFYATTTLHPASGSVFQHEIGHSYVSLDDEYEDANICDQQPGRYGPPNEVNTTAQNTRANAPWQVWIDAGTPIPTVGSTPAVPGLYEGGKYCSTGVWRPTFDSLMRSLNQPMDQINTEEFVRQFNTTAPGFDSVSPRGGNVTVTNNSRTRFQVVPKTITGQAFAVTWRVNGQLVLAPSASSSGPNAPAATDGIGFAAENTRYVFDAAQWGAGQHTITATVRDATALVRNDPTNRTTTEQRWTVTVENRASPDARLVTAVLPNARSMSALAPATAFVTVINSGRVQAQRCTLNLQNENGGAATAAFSYRGTHPDTNVPIGPDNPAFDLGAGSSATFVFSATYAAPANSDEIFVVADCDNSDPSPRGAGVNSAMVTASAGQTPDIVAVAATAPTAGVVDLPSDGRRGAVALSAVNIGSAGTVVLRGDLGPVSLPLEIEFCETNPATGACTSARSNRLEVTFAQNEVKTFALFARARGPIRFAPERFRVFASFVEGQTIRGGTSVAARTVE